MAYDIISWQGSSLSSHKSQTAAGHLMNYRTICLSVSYNLLAQPLYTAVMLKRPEVHPEVHEPQMTAAEFSEKIDKMWDKQQYGAYLVTATGTVEKPLFAASFRPMTDKPIVRYGILGTGNQMSELNTEFWTSGYIPVSFDAFGTAENTQLVAVWHKNTARATWNIAAASYLSDAPGRQAIFNAITLQGARPTVIAMAPGKRYFGLFVDNKVGNWYSRTDLSENEYKTLVGSQIAAGNLPISVATEHAFISPRYSVIFADREKPIDRMPTVSVQNGLPKMEGIDNAMLRFMKDHAIRGASLAITEGTRLVYAAGYTVAEPGYPEHKETTLFRQASVSKTFAAAAIYRLIQLGTKTPDGQTFDLDTPMQSVLKLKTPDGQEPVDPRFGDISIRDLMESCSSIDQGLLWADEQAVNAFDGSLPCSPAQLAAYIAAQKMGEKTPGSHDNVVYGNADYFLLGQVIAKLTNSASFEEGLKKLVLDPLSISRVRQSRSLFEQQAADEARHHIVNVDPALKAGKSNEYETAPLSLLVSGSRVSPDRPLVPDHYGGINYELFDGSGGLSAAVTDIARLVAAFSLSNEKAVFSESILKRWFADVFIAGRLKSSLYPELPAHGYHGFDWGTFVNPATPSQYIGNFSAAKGGWLYSHSTSLYFNAGGFGYIVAFNSTTQSDIKTDWLVNHEGLQVEVAPDSILAISQTHDWKGVDLFPHYGMPALDPKLHIKFPIGHIDFPKLVIKKPLFADLNKLERSSIQTLKHRTRRRSG